MHFDAAAHPETDKIFSERFLSFLNVQVKRKLMKDTEQSLQHKIFSYCPSTTPWFNLTLESLTSFEKSVDFKIKVRIQLANMSIK